MTEVFVVFLVGAGMAAIGFVVGVHTERERWVRRARSAFSHREVE